MYEAIHKMKMASAGEIKTCFYAQIETSVGPEVPYDIAVFRDGPAFGGIAPRGVSSMHSTSHYNNPLSKTENDL